MRLQFNKCQGYRLEGAVRRIDCHPIRHKLSEVQVGTEAHGKGPCRRLRTRRYRSDRQQRNGIGQTRCPKGSELRGVIGGRIRVGCQGGVERSAESASL